MMRRVLISLFSLAFLTASMGVASAAQAAIATDICSSISTNYNGQAACVSSYDTCIGNRPGDTSGCSNMARQIGQSTYNNGACGAQGGTNCADVPEGALNYINTPREATPATVQSAPDPASQAGTRQVVNGKFGYIPLEPLPGMDTKALANGNANFGDLLKAMFRILIYVAGMMAVAAFVLGGITYMVSEVTEQKIQAKERIQAAAWGLLIILGSWLILNTINPQLVNFSSTLNPLSGKDGQVQGPDYTARDINDCTDAGGVWRAGQGCQH